MNPAKYKSTLLFMLCMMFLFWGSCIITLKFPMQELKVTAKTAAEEFDMSGTVRVCYLKPLDAGKTYKAVMKFMAVKNTSEDLFTPYGRGQYVYLGCSELTAECSFTSLGRFLRVRLTLNAAQTDLKLEDGTPFDITRYSLRPVLVMEE